MADLVGWLSGLETLVSVVYIYIYNPKNPFWFGTLVGTSPSGRNWRGSKDSFLCFFSFFKDSQGMPGYASLFS